MKRFRFNTARAWVAAVVFVSVVAGLVLRAGWGNLSSLGLGAVAYLCPLGALETLAAAHTMVPRAAIALVVAVVVAVLAGRVFCGWVCPVPHVVKFFHPTKKKVAPSVASQQSLEAHALTEEDAAEIRAQADALVGKGCAGCLPPVGGARDGFQLDARHGVLAGALISTAVCGFPVFCLVCPVGLSFGLVVALWHAFAEQTPTLSLLVFPLILAAELVFFRKWCHSLCPMGALFSLLGRRAPLAHPHVEAKKCLRASGVDCHACTAACPELLDPHTLDIPECTRCAACIDACPAQAITLKLQNPTLSERPTQ